ncbi:uncharacterized protein LOC141631365 [Silene latifolia]|uniref:uncharacterized protein LOC141631365 n=1 Tax=Silene latifolia TaxID=37657 RepID=UPI003D76E3F4
MSASLEKATPDSYVDSPFIDAISLVNVRKGFSARTMTLYGSTTNSFDHVSQYKQKMLFITAVGHLTEACICKGFGSKVFEDALQWFIGFLNISLVTFADLVNTFTQYFASIKTEKYTSNLYSVVQGFDEKIRDSITRFKKEKVAIRDCDVPTAIEAFRQGLHHDSDMYKECTRHPCRTFKDVQAKATAAMRLEEDMLARISLPSMERTTKKAASEKKDEISKPYSRVVNKVEDREDTHSLSRLSEYGFTIGMGGLLQALRQQDKVGSTSQTQPSAPLTYTKIINVITGSSDLSGLTYSAAKRHATEAKGNRPESSCRVTHNNLSVIAFDEVDIHDSQEHHDALIIRLSIEICIVKKVLVNIVNSVNLVMLETTRNIGFSEKDLRGSVERHHIYLDRS